MVKITHFMFLGISVRSFAEKVYENVTTSADFTFAQLDQTLSEGILEVFKSSRLELLAVTI